MPSITRRQKQNMVCHQKINSSVEIINQAALTLFCHAPGSLSGYVIFLDSLRCRDLTAAQLDTKDIDAWTKVRQEAASWRRSSARSLFSQRKLRQEPLQGSLLENCRCQIFPDFLGVFVFFFPICVEKIKSRRKLPSQNLGRKGSRKSSNQLA